MWNHRVHGSRDRGRRRVRPRQGKVYGLAGLCVPASRNQSCSAASKPVSFFMSLQNILRHRHGERARERERERESARERARERESERERERERNACKGVSLVWAPCLCVPGRGLVEPGGLDVRAPDRRLTLYCRRRRQLPHRHRQVRRPPRLKQSQQNKSLPRVALGLPRSQCHFGWCQEWMTPLAQE